MRSQEFTGKTTQEAIDTGLAALGVTIADVHVDVIQEGAKGLFGLFGSKPARVRITVMDDEREDDHGLSDLLGSFSLDNEAQARRKKAEKKPAPKAEAKPAAEKKAAPKAEAVKAEAKSAEKKAPKAEKPAPVLEEAKQPETGAAAVEPVPKAEDSVRTEAAPKEERAKRPRKPRAQKPAREKAPKEQEAPREEREYAPMIPAEPFNPTEPPVIHDEATPAGRAQRFLMDVTERMNVKVDVYVDDSREDSLYIHMVGDTLGILIGRRGETLDALQYLTSLQVNKGREGYIRVTLDTENYRAKREDSLRRLAQRMANRAQKTGRKVVLEPMNPYERRVLHTALQNHPAVTTHSEGEEPNRRVVIMLKNQPERSEQGTRPERAEHGDKPASSRRSRSRRRGRRGPKPEAVQNAAPQSAQEDIVVSETPVDVLGAEE
ncbi:MAG: RNA-binding cell elongation regulator Jag/EloR [Clostridia bacterium]|nr:RNA-binding cell elongation regulator Jag/EloR [Clostridia bacterium]